MSLISNNNTLHLYNRWISPWYENNPIYSNLIYSDIYVSEYIDGIYYQLKIPCNVPILRSLNWNKLIVRLNLFLFKKRKQKRSSLFFINKKLFSVFYKKFFYLFHKTIRKRNANLNKIKNSSFLFYLDKYSRKYKYGIIKLKLIKPAIRSTPELIDNIYLVNIKMKGKEKNSKLSYLMVDKKKLNFSLYASIYSQLFLNKIEFNFLYTFGKNKYYLSRMYISLLNEKQLILDKYMNKIKFESIFYKFYFFSIKKIKFIKKLEFDNIFLNKLCIYRGYNKIFGDIFNNKTSRKKQIINMRIYRNIVKKWKFIKKNNYINKLKIKKFLHEFKRIKQVLFFKKRKYFKKKIKLTKKKRRLRRFVNIKKYKVRLSYSRKLKLKLKFRKRKKKIKFKKRNKGGRRIFIRRRKERKKKLRKKRKLNFDSPILKEKNKKILKSKRVNTVFLNISIIYFVWLYNKLTFWYILLYINVLLTVFLLKKQNLSFVINVMCVIIYFIQTI